jgi:hypothetical protein
MLTPVYVYNKDLPQSRIPSTSSLLPIRDLPAASITINYSFVTFNYSFVTIVHNIPYWCEDSNMLRFIPHGVKHLLYHVNDSYHLV